MYDMFRVEYKNIDDLSKIITKDVKVFKTRKSFNSYVKQILPQHMSYLLTIEFIEHQESKGAVIHHLYVGNSGSGSYDMSIEMDLLRNGIQFVGSKFWKEFLTPGTPFNC